MAIVYTIYCWQDVTLTGSPSVQQQRPISATVKPASSVRCNRISLPARLCNATTAPYNPAAMRHPASGNWFLVHNYDEVITRALQGFGALYGCFESEPQATHGAHSEQGVPRVNREYLSILVCLYI